MFLKSKLSKASLISGLMTLLFGVSLIAASTAVVTLDASKLVPGSLEEWQNSGSMGGSLRALDSGGAAVGTVDGRKAVIFDGGSSFFRSSFVTTDAMTGSNPFTIAVWVYNPTIDKNEEPLVYWAHRGDNSRTAHLNYGTSVGSGAYVHWGADAGYAGGSPEAGKWHFIVLTYAGGKDGVENLYVDGKLNKSAKRSLNLFKGDPIYLGTTDLENFFSGSIASVKMFSFAVSEAEVGNLMRGIVEEALVPMVDLGAAGLPDGKLTKWENKGKLGGYFGLQSSAPKVVDLVGVKAVSFDGKMWLQSAFDVPFSNKYTVEAWVLRKEVRDGACPVVSFGSSDSGEQARFSFSSASKDGAFLSGKTSIAFDRPYPAANKWHHVAYTSDGSTIRVYVDGELVKEDVASTLVSSSFPVMLGGAWPTKKGIPFSSTDLLVKKVCVYDTALSQREIRNNEGLLNTFAPTPANKGQMNGFTVTLKWSEGKTDFDKCNVYIGTSKEDVEKADASSKLLKSSVPMGKCELGPIPVDLATTYYWRVDEIGATETLKGEVWSFATETGRAENPTPRTNISAVSAKTKKLAWVPGKYATTQTVYFSDNRADVESGKAVVAKDLAAKVSECKIVKKLTPGTTYFWRIDNQNGKHPSTTGDVWSFRTTDTIVENDVTFLATSDLHYGASPLATACNEATIDFMNAIPGTQYPKSVGGNVATPRGVVLTGDLTNSGTSEQWAQFTKDWGVNCEGRICYPVYEGFGNHDGSLSPGAAPARGIIERNKTRVGVKNVSPDGLHYSWDWGQVHFDELNLYAGDVRVKEGKMDGPGHEPHYSLQFLKDDLAKNVGKSGRPVIIAMHLGFDEGFSLGWGWWAPKEVDAFYEAIKDYNVIGILYGHTHAAENYKWRGFDVYNCASSNRDPNPGECLVFHITPTELVVIQRFKDRWADNVWRKPITGIK